MLEAQETIKEMLDEWRWIKKQPELVKHFYPDSATNRLDNMNNPIVLLDEERVRNLASQFTNGAHFCSVEQDRAATIKHIIDATNTSPPATDSQEQTTLREYMVKAVKILDQMNIPTEDNLTYMNVKKHIIDEAVRAVNVQNQRKDSDPISLGYSVDMVNNAYIGARGSGVSR